jgi:hypothetical protein
MSPRIFESQLALMIPNVSLVEKGTLGPAKADCQCPYFELETF